MDTHAWVWWVDGSRRLSAGALRAIEAADVLGVSPISCWEVGVLVAKGRLNLDREVLQWVSHALGRPLVEVLHFSPEIAVASTMFGTTFHGDPADRILVATARNYGAPMVTRDRRIRSAGLVDCIW